MSLTPEQLLERRSGLGGSDSAPAVGLSRWKTPLELYLEKIGEREDQVDEDALHIRMGEALEPIAIARFEKQTHFKVTDQQRKIFDPEWPRRWVTVDGLSSDGGVIQAKSVGFADPAEWGDENEDDAVPMQYLVQCQHELACTGRSHAWMPLIISNRQFRLYRVQRDEELIALITQKEREFWDHVERREPPAPITLEDATLMWPSHQDTKVEITKELGPILFDLKVTKAKIKAAEKRKEDLELRIKNHMGANATLVDGAGGVLVTWKQAKPSQVFDADSFAIAQPDLYRQYLKDKPGSRRFLVK